MSQKVISRDLANILNSLYNYLNSKQPLDERFAQSVAGVQRLAANDAFFSKDEFRVEVEKHYPHLTDALRKVGHGRLVRGATNVRCCYAEIHDTLTAKIDVADVVREVTAIAPDDNHWDNGKRLVAELIKIHASPPNKKTPEHALTEAQKRYSKFLEVLKENVTATSVAEVLMLMQLVASHPRFKAKINVSYTKGGQIDVAATVEKMFKVANDISLSDKSPFVRYTDKAGRKRFSYQLASSGNPDALFLDQDSNGVCRVNVGFASMSRDTKIEGNTFLRHCLDGAALQALLELNDVNMCSSNLYAIKQAAKNYSSMFKTSDDSSTYITPKANLLNSHGVLGNIKDLISTKNLHESEVDEIMTRARGMIDGNQATRALFFIRLNGYLKGKMPLSDINSVKISNSDFNEIYPSGSKQTVYVTTSPHYRVMNFMQTTSERVSPEDKFESELLTFVANADERKTFRGMCRKAFLSIGGNIAGRLIVDHKVTKAFLDKMDFVSDSSDFSMEERLSSAVLSLMFTKDAALWEAIKQEISDVSVFKLPFSSSARHEMGIFAEERSNIVVALRVLIEAYNKELAKGGDGMSILANFLGEKNAAHVASQINDGVLKDMVARFDTESEEFIQSGVRPALSEKMDEMARLCQSFRTLDSTVSNLRHSTPNQTNASKLSARGY